MKENYIITIGRQLGSGGREIGLKLAESLGISFYDKELIRLASKESGLNEKVFESADEKKRFNIFWGLFGIHSSTQTPEIYSGYYLSNEALFKIQSDVIRNLAEKKSCLFVGRCADYILKELPQLISIVLNADPDDHVGRMMKVRGINEKQACERIDKTHKQGESYCNDFSSKLWGAAGSYHLCINTSVLGIEETTAFIRSFAEKRFRL